MQDFDPVPESFDASKLIELDPELWIAIAGGIPRNGWLFFEQRSRTPAETYGVSE